MATKILIPTPLRPYTDKQEAVEAHGATDRRAARGSDEEALRPQGASLQRAGQAAELRQRLSERRDIRYLQKEQTPVSPGDTISIIPSVAGGGHGDSMRHWRS